MDLPSRYSNLEGLIGLAHRHGIDVKPTLLRVLTDLYIQKRVHTADEEREYAAMALSLLDAVDAATRAVVARTLAAYPGAPAAVLRRLGNINGGSDPVALPLLDFRSPRSPAEPQSASPPDLPDPAKPELTEVFFAADAADRRLILANLHYADDVRLPRTPPGDPGRAARQLERASLEGRPGEVTRELERALALSRAMAERIVGDASGEPMVVAAKALDMPLAVLQRVLFFVNPAVGHSVERVYALSALFEEISPEAARYLVSLWRDSPTAKPLSHRARTSDDDRRRRRDEPTVAGGHRAILDDDDRSRSRA